MRKRLSLPQRMVRTVVNFLVERFFPSGLFFYGRGPLRAFDRMDQEKGSGAGTIAAMYLARLAYEQNATVLSIEATGMTINREDIGDWRVTVERIDLPPKPALLGEAGIRDGAPQPCLALPSHLH